MLLIGVLLLCLLFMLWQDWKYRRIHVLLPLVVYGIGFYVTQNVIDYKMVLLNSAFFIIVFMFLMVYMSFKAKAFLNPLNHYFGLGDILFYLAITPLFYLKQYAVFFVASMLFAIVLQLAFKKQSNHDTVPLAGFSSLLLLITIIVDVLQFSNYKFTLV